MIFDWLKNLFAVTPAVIEYRIKCRQCGSLVTVRVFPDRDLNPTYDDAGPAYTLSKEVTDSSCFQIMHLTADFDAGRRELNRSVTNGDLVAGSGGLNP